MSSLVITINSPSVALPGFQRSTGRDDHFLNDNVCINHHTIQHIILLLVLSNICFTAGECFWVIIPSIYRVSWCLPVDLLQENSNRQFMLESKCGASVCDGEAQIIREPEFSKMPFFSSGHSSLHSLLFVWPSFNERFLTIVVNVDISLHFIYFFFSLSLSWAHTAVEEAQGWQIQFYWQQVSCPRVCFINAQRWLNISFPHFCYWEIASASTFWS